MFVRYQELLHAYPYIKNVIDSGITIVFLMAVHLMIQVGYKVINHRLPEQKQLLRIFCSSILQPIKFIIWVIGFWFIFTQLVPWHQQSFIVVLNISFIFIKLSTITAVAWALFKLSNGLKQYYIKIHARTDGGYNDFSLIETSYKCARVIILIIVFFASLSALNISTFALAGLTTVVSGFIAISQQELIKNLFGGVVLHLDRPFSVGDWIYTVNGGIEGIVEKISFRLTQIRGFDKRPIYVPNATFLTAAVVNASRMTNRRILQYIGIRYEDFQRLPMILEAIKKMLLAHPDIDQKMTTRVCLINGKTNMGSTTESAFGASSINFMVCAFTKTTNSAKFQRIQDDIMMKVGQVIVSHGGQIAYPTTTLDIPHDALASMSGDKES